MGVKAFVQRKQLRRRLLTQVPLVTCCPILAAKAHKCASEAKRRIAPGMLDRR